MKRTFLLCALVFAIATSMSGAVSQWQSPVYNWGSGWCGTCYVRANIDIPSNEWTGYLAGWAFREFDGASITNVYVLIDGVNQEAWLVTGLYRPDVGSYSGNDYNGWHIYLPNGIAGGAHDVSVVFRHGELSTTQTGVVTAP